MFVNTTRNTTVVNSGCIKCHNGPKIVCLYCAVKSRFTNIQSRSLYFHTSLRLMSRRWDWGFISRSHSSEVEGVEWVEDEIVEGFEVVEVEFSSGKSLLSPVFSTLSFTLFICSCML